MYKTFIIGNPESVWIREYVKEIHIKNGHEVYIGTFNRISDKMAVEYELLGVKIVEFGHINGIAGKIQKTLRLLFFAIRHSKKIAGLIFLKYKVYRIHFKQRYYI